MNEQKSDSDMLCITRVVVTRWFIGILDTFTCGYWFQTFYIHMLY